MKNFLTPLAPSGPLRSKFFQKTLILAFEANSALSRENETKIVKITHSAHLLSTAQTITLKMMMLKKSISFCVYFSASRVDREAP